MELKRYQIAAPALFAGIVFFAGLAGADEPWPYPLAVSVSALLLSFLLIPADPCGRGERQAKQRQHEKSKGGQR
jgi:hypothetical protein